MEISPKPPTARGPADTFTGEVWVEPITPGLAPSPLSVAAPATLRVALEIGTRWCFASALDWPGWCRRGRGEEEAVEALLGYSDRYATIAAAAGGRFEPGEVEIVGRVPGDAGTEFGVPAVWGPWDALPAEGAALDRLLGLLDASWDYLDEVIRTAPPELRKGPRGGGRDRDAVAEHVRAAERAYAGKVGGRLPPRAPWPEQRAALRAALRADPPPGAPGGSAWPLRYAIRRCAWHVLDHAWEVEDRSEAGR